MIENTKTERVMSLPFGSQMQMNERMLMTFLVMMLAKGRGVFVLHG